MPDTSRPSAELWARAAEDSTPERYIEGLDEFIHETWVRFKRFFVHDPSKTFEEHEQHFKASMRRMFSESYFRD